MICFKESQRTIWYSPGQWNKSKVCLIQRTCTNGTECDAIVSLNTLCEPNILPCLYAYSKCNKGYEPTALFRLGINICFGRTNHKYIAMMDNCSPGVLMCPFTTSDHILSVAGLPNLPKSNLISHSNQPQKYYPL